MRLHINLFSLPALAVVLVGLVMGLLLIATAFGAHARPGGDPGAGWMQQLAD
jgi:hypothetical protein